MLGHGCCLLTFLFILLGCLENEWGSLQKKVYFLLRNQMKKKETNYEEKVYYLIK